MLFLLACASPDAALACPEDAAAPTFELGEGEVDFDPLEPGEEPTLWHGPQGGTHLMLAAEVVAEDLTAVPLSLRTEAWSFGEACTDGCLLADATFDLDPSRAITEDDEGWTFGHLQLIVTTWPTDELRELDLTLTDACGRETAATVSLEPTLE